MTATLETPRRFLSAPAAPVELHLARPRRIGAGTRLLVVLHGVLRNAAEYLDDWRDWAVERDRVVACPGFLRADWPRGTSYALGGVTSRGYGRGAVRPRREWAFTVVERLAVHLRDELGLRTARFDLWGHSAGGQFAHRFPLFCPQAPVRRIVASGTGWYLAPDPDVPFPHGLRHPQLAIDPGTLRAWTRRDLVLLRGERDVRRDPHLRCDAATDAQGPTRWHRAAHMLERARAADPGTRWRLIDVAGAGHHHTAMARATQALWELTDDLEGSR